jgi:hypothetical protein
VVDTGNSHVLGYVRMADGERLLVFANFSERPQQVSANQLRLYGLSYDFQDLLRGERLEPGDLNLEPYDFVCLAI